MALDYKELGKIIKDIHHAFSRQAGRSVNMALTLRNWFIGFYIKEYEQDGQDRAQYGTQLLQTLAKDLQKANIPATASRSLRQYRQFYEAYPEIGQTASAQLNELQDKHLLPSIIWQTPSTKSPAKITQSIDPETPRLPCEQLVSGLSYSHFVELIKIDEPLKRSFYEIESIRSNWGSRELRRQISTLYYERFGYSKDKTKIAKMVETGTYAHDIKDVIREPYMFEFVGVNYDDFNEATLAKALLNQLNKFFLEMGRGFCFEASNKKILIGDQFFFVDLVLYHRILKCHFLIELKINELHHDHVSQLNTYVNYYRENEMHSNDNPPVGLLLCTEKNEALAKYALGGIDNHLYISKYKLELPTSEEIKAFLESKLKELPQSLIHHQKENSLVAENADE
ncbi:PDDEXK nuclease domain-containing protein [Candidiatus Paracoxiella cheracis]|uniref:PDDEXK nuclease domain-containing protein n=1 Tax=Candidiatus Paracoxiella cheracis TaxID=3405120 RepID=UPI003BF4C652